MSKKGQSNKKSRVIPVMVSLLAATWCEAKENKTFIFTPQNPSGFTVITNDLDLPVLAYQKQKYGTGQTLEHAPLPDGIQAEIVYPNVTKIQIKNQTVSAGRIHTNQAESLPPVADRYNDVALSSGFPFMITEADLPYQESFDTTQSTDDGDFRGSAADSISRPGGHDGFWLFTPENTGTYLFTMSATKGDSTPIPGHDFERGFAGIGVWQDNGEGQFTEVGTANSVIGDSILPATLNAGKTYSIIWEDYFVGSTENSVTLSIEYLGEPAGNTIEKAVSLFDLTWNFEVTVDTTANQNLEDSFCVEPQDAGVGHGSGSGGLTGAEVWYRLPAVEAGNQYSLNILPDNSGEPVIDTAMTLHAYDTQVHQIAPVECSDNIDPENRLSSITFTAEENRLYYLMVETVPAFDQRSFDQFVLQGIKQSTSSVLYWNRY